MGKDRLRLSAPGMTMALAALLFGAGELGARDQAPGDRGDPGPAARGPVVLITGSTGGLGREVARALAAEGAHIIVHGRSEERGRELVAEIEEAGVGTAAFYQADLASLAETRGLARDILRDYDRLDVLVNNAGVWADGPESRTLTDDGIEWAFQINYLSHYVLSRKLLPVILDTAERKGEARIVNVASIAQRPIDFDDPMMDRDYSHGRGYAQSKLAQVLFTMDLAEELRNRDVIVTALHPATMMDTDMVLSRGAQPRTSVDEGRDAVVNLVLSAEVESGSYYNGLRPARANDQAYDPEARRQLRELAEELSGVR
jgi:NAD(P)-dependent dehydrogenase (short-subunit alcohol dehydrogenase family)